MITQSKYLLCPRHSFHRDSALNCRYETYPGVSTSTPPLGLNHPNFEIDRVPMMLFGILRPAPVGALLDKSISSDRELIQTSHCILFSAGSILLTAVTTALRLDEFVRTTFGSRSAFRSSNDV
ncbi:hypothetical protein AAHC03_01773 [Spirometra sp. Aus1]